MIKLCSGCCAESGLERAGEADAAKQKRDDHGWPLWFQEIKRDMERF